MYTDYFLDSENLGSDTLNFIQYLNKSDKFYIFYSDKSQKPSYDMIEKLMNCDCSVKLIECENGTPNSMDFKIVSFLGLKIGGYKNLKKNKHRYVILSADKGYDTTISFYQSMNIHIERWSDLTNILPEEWKREVPTDSCISNRTLTPAKQAKREQEKIQVRATLSSNKMYDTIIRDCISKSENVTIFHNMLQKSTNAYIKKHSAAIYREYKQQFLASKKA